MLESFGTFANEMKTIFILFLAVVSYASSTEEEPNLETDPDPLPPETFEILFNNRVPNFMILDASRYWDTKTEFKNFDFIREKIEDELTDEETKKYAESLMSEATRRLRNRLKNFGLKLDDEYDFYDFIREWKNIEDGTPPFDKDLYEYIDNNF